MSFDGRSFLTSARQLASPAPEGMPLDIEEANVRSAISRAYYAAFWRARTRYLADGERMPRMDAHQIVIDAFRTSRYRNRMAIGAHLSRLRVERNTADYQANIGTLSDLRARAQRMIDTAALVLTAIDRLDA